VYRWAAPADITPLTHLLAAICAREIDAVTFTSAPAAASLVALAGEHGQRDELVESLKSSVLAACVGPVSHAPLADLDIPAVIPSRFRLGAMVRSLSEALPSRTPQLPVAGHTLQLRGHAAIVDGVVKPLSPNAMALMRALTARPGRVVPRRALAESLPYTPSNQPCDDHAVEQAIARLRASLGTPKLVQTVIKRGYRLRLEPLQNEPRCTEPADQGARS
jgi:uroporphyrinogen-III synthase